MSLYDSIYLEVIGQLFSYGPLYLTLECNIGPRRLRARANIA